MKLPIPSWSGPLLIVSGLALFAWLDLLAPGPARQALATATCKQLPNCRKGQFNYQQWPPRLEVTIADGTATDAQIRRGYQATISAADADVAFFAPNPARITYRGY